MPSLWGSKKRDEEQDVERVDHDARDSVDGADRPTSSRREPDERTRLLPSQPQPRRSGGYLDPDDPAVSPYNLWTVRILRFFTIVFLILTAVWWLLLLISIFITPPGMATRGSGFFDFSYTTLTAGNLIVALLFFTAPSRAMRVLTGLIAFFVFIDMVIILSVEHIRNEENWAGIASVIWAFLMAIWCILVDRVVAWGKKEEEERLTGRAETRRSIKEWFAVMAATIILVIFVIIVILMTGCVSIRARDATLDSRMEGERYLVDGDKYNIHLACVGNSTKPSGQKVPTVILEGGELPVEWRFEPWLHDTWVNGTIDRYCFWDRPGYAWSDTAPSPHSAGMSADALTEALALAGEEGPWVLVSAGTGSIVSRIFSGRHPHEVKGMMMVDPMHEDLLKRLASPTRGFLLWGWGIVSPLGIERLIGAIFQGRNREDRVYGKNAYQNGKFVKAQLQENLVADSLSKSEVKSSRIIQREDTPLVLVSSGNKMKADREWEKKQGDLSRLTNRLLSWDVVPHAPHEVWTTAEGRRTMEKRLGQLVKKVKKGMKKEAEDDVLLDEEAVNDDE